MSGAFGGHRGVPEGPRRATELQSCFCSPCLSVSEVEGASKHVSPFRHPPRPGQWRFLIPGLGDSATAFSKGWAGLVETRRRETVLGAVFMHLAAMALRRRTLHHVQLLRRPPLFCPGPVCPSSRDSLAVAAYSPHIRIFCLEHPSACQPSYRTPRPNSRRVISTRF